MGASKNSYPGSDKDPLGLPANSGVRTALDPLNAAPYYAGADKKSAPPQGPSITGAAERQTQADRPDINTPFSSQSWTQDANGKWHMNSTLSPEVEQAAKNAPGIDWGSLPQLDYGEKARTQATDAAYNQAQSRLNPQWAQRDEQLRSQLANQGLDPNSEAGRNAMQRESMERNDAYSSAENAAVQQGRLAANDVYDQSARARQQALAEALGRHELPIQDLQSEQGFIKTPDFKSSADMTGAAAAESNNDLQRWMADMKKRAGGMGGLMSLIQAFFA